MGEERCNVLRQQDFRKRSNFFHSRDQLSTVLLGGDHNVQKLFLSAGGLPHEPHSEILRLGVRGSGHTEQGFWIDLKVRIQRCERYMAFIKDKALSLNIEGNAQIPTIVFLLEV